MPALEVGDLTFAYGRAKVLRDVSLHVDHGEIVTVIGPNGAGKSTLMGVIAGVHKAGRGTINIEDRDVTHSRQADLVRSGCILVPEGRQVFSSLTVADNLRLGMYTRRRHSRFDTEVKQVYELFPQLAQRSAQLAGTLSGGEQQMVAIGRALMGRPRLMLLDEPTLGLSPQMTQLIMSTLARLRREGLTIVIVEQNALAALKLADRGYLLHTGSVVRSGPSDELAEDEFVRHVYLGSAPAEGASGADTRLRQQPDRG